MWNVGGVDAPDADSNLLANHGAAQQVRRVGQAFETSVGDDQHVGVRGRIEEASNTLLAKNTKLLMPIVTTQSNVGLA